MSNRIKITSFITITLFSSLLVIGCNSIKSIKLESPSQAAQSIQLTVSAAASLKNAIADIEPLYQKAHPETEIIYNFASSGSLQRQIEQGAPVDVFISAANKQMNALEKQELLLTETRQDLLTNQMVFVTASSRAKSNPKLDNFYDLASKEIATIALGEPSSVPAGQYTQEVLDFFNIADKVNAKAVYGKDVRQVLNYVATGNVDAGIVYRTDAQSADNVEIVAIAPETTHSPVVYPIAAIKDSSHPEHAKDLIEFFSTPEAQQVFEEHGFMTMGDNEK